MCWHIPVRTTHISRAHRSHEAGSWGTAQHRLRVRNAQKIRGSELFNDTMGKRSPGLHMKNYAGWTPDWKGILKSSRDLLSRHAMTTISS